MTVVRLYHGCLGFVDTPPALSGSYPGLAPRGVSMWGGVRWEAGGQGFTPFSHQLALSTQVLSAWKFHPLNGTDNVWEGK